MPLVFRRVVFVAVQAAVCLAAWIWYGLEGLQWCLFGITLSWVCFRFFFILDMIVRLLIGNLLLAVLIVAFYLTLSGLVGTSYGLMNLFWHEDLATRFSAAFFSTLFFGLIFLAAFYADPNKLDTQGYLRAYLLDNRSLVRIIEDAFQWALKTVKLVAGWIFLKGWAGPAPVRVMHAWGDNALDGCGIGFESKLIGANGLPDDGKSWIILAVVNDVLHLRIFNPYRRIVLDRDEGQLNNQAAAIAGLKGQLTDAWPRQDRTADQQLQLINDIASTFDCPTHIELSVQDYIKRFLTVFFYPFWWLLLLPAVAPVAYPYLPKTIPTKVANLPLPWNSWSDNNVWANPMAWLGGLLIWGLGAWAGRLALWGYVEVNRRLYGVLDPWHKGDPTLRSHFDRIMDFMCPLDESQWDLSRLDPATEGARWRNQLRGAIIRYTVSVIVVYALGVLCNLVFASDWGYSQAGPLAKLDRRIAIGFWIGVVYFAASLFGMIFFLRTSLGSYRQNHRRKEWLHILLAVGLGIGVALVGLQSAVFQVFIVLAVFAIFSIVVTRFSETWNWPLSAFPLRYLIPILFLVVLWVTNSSQSKLRIPDLEKHYAARVWMQPTLPPTNQMLTKADLEGSPCDGSIPDPPLGDQGSKDDLAVLKLWKAAAQRRMMPKAGSTEKPNPKLAILATSGGANRAAFWTAAVLEKLEEKLVDGAQQPDFRPQLRLITGASGGMVGAGYYVAAQADPKANLPARNPPGWLIDKIPRDSLSTVVRQWMLGDVPTSFWPLDLPNAWDRGVALERAWPDLQIPYSTLADPELKGEIPSMILSPMLIEDGRQLLISNLPLRFLTYAGGNLLDPQSNLYSFPSVEFFKLFPDERTKFNLATAVRLNASFPYVSPALYLPTDPYRRVVDAGYYDNYGIEVAASWIYHHRKWLKCNTSGIVLIQVRAYPKQVDRLKLMDPEPSNFGGLSRSIQFVTSPIEGGSMSRDAATLFRNDQILDSLDKWFKDQGDGDLFTTALFENVLDLAMTWYTTERELELLKIGFGQEPDRAKNLVKDVANSNELENRIQEGIEKNRQALEALERWWQRH